MGHSKVYRTTSSVQWAQVRSTCVGASHELRRSACLSRRVSADIFYEVHDNRSKWVDPSHELEPLERPQLVWETRIRKSLASQARTPSYLRPRLCKPSCGLREAHLRSDERLNHRSGSKLRSKILFISEQWFNRILEYIEFKWNIRIKAEMFSTKRMKNCFELFGFDFMIDEDLRVWLIEANRNPGFGLPTDKAKSLIDSMVDEMLTLVVDPLFSPKSPSIISRTSFNLISFRSYDRPCKRNSFFSVNDCIDEE